MCTAVPEAPILCQGGIVGLSHLPCACLHFARAQAAATAMRLVNASPSQLLQAAGMPLLSSMSEPFLSTGEDRARGDALSAPPKPAAYQASLQDSTSALAELHEDLLEGILAKLGGNNRQALLGACKRLRDAAAPTFTQLALPVPALHKDGYAATAGARMAPMRGLTLQLPAAPGTKDGSCVTDPCAATDAFIARCLAALPDGKLAVEVLRIQAAAEAQSNGSTPVPRQVSYEALAKLAAATPKLRRLSLPLLSSPAAAALPMFTQQLSTLRLTVSDSPSLVRHGVSQPRTAGLAAKQDGSNAPPCAHAPCHRRTTHCSYATSSTCPYPRARAFCTWFCPSASSPTWLACRACR